MASKTPSSRVQLPAEVLLHIFDSLVPSFPIALPASDPITKTLLSLTLTSRELYPIALRYLYTQCLCIDSLSRLYLVVDTLCLLSNRDVENISSLPTTSIIPHIKSLNLSLLRDNHFPDNPFDPKLSIPHISTEDLYNIQHLLRILAPSLQRLVLDIRLPSLIGEYRPDVSTVEALRASCFALHELEVFCSLRDHAFIPLTKDVDKPNVMVEAWPKLRVLGLCYLSTLNSGAMWQAVGQMQCLETVICVCKESGFLRARETWIPDDVIAHGGRQLNAVFVNVSHAWWEFSERWKIEKNVKVREVQFPVQSAVGRYRKQSLEWIKSRILNGDEWSES